MPTTEPRRTPEEVARLGAEVYERLVRPALKPEDDGKYVAIDVLSGEFEVDENDHAAVTRLRSRIHGGEYWLGGVGRLAAYSIRHYR